MAKWIKGRFKDARTAFASVMAIAGVVGTLCCLGVICIVLTYAKP